MAGKIKKLLENELVGGTQSIDVYPVTSIKAIYDEANKRLDTILSELASKIPEDYVKSEEFSEVFTALQQTIVNEYFRKDSVTQKTGSSTTSVMSQDAVTKALGTKLDTESGIELSEQVYSLFLNKQDNLITGMINLTESAAYNTLTANANALSNNQMKYYLITDSKGKLPSLTGEKKITMYSTVGKLFHPSQNSVGVSVGDIAVIAKINNVAVYYVQPRYEAKAPSGNFPGCDGFMSAGDKQNLTNAINNSNTAIDQIDKTCFRCYNGEYNANNCFWYGYYMYVNFGRPAGSEDGENYLLRVADIGKTSDNKFVIEQTLYSNKHATKIFRRIIKVIDKRGAADPSNVEYTDWEAIGSGGSEDTFLGYLDVSFKRDANDSEIKNSFTDLYRLIHNKPLKDGIQYTCICSSDSSSSYYNEPVATILKFKDAYRVTVKGPETTAPNYNYMWWEAVIYQGTPYVQKPSVTFTEVSQQ